jgi:hypothetical protein
MNWVFVETKGSSRPRCLAITAGQSLVAAATATVKTTASSAKAATAATVFPGLGFANGERSAIQLSSIQSLNRGQSRFFGVQFDKRESARAACVSVGNDARRADLTVLAELFL